MTLAFFRLTALCFHWLCLLLSHPLQSAPWFFISPHSPYVDVNLWFAFNAYDILAVFVSVYGSQLLFTAFPHCLPPRGNSVCPEWAASGHCKGQDADLSFSVPRLHPLPHGHLQTSGTAWSLPGHHAGSDGQHRWELCAFYELRLLSAGHPLRDGTGQRSCAEVEQALKENVKSTKESPRYLTFLYSLPLW